jgi:L-ascorbate metabolism protein UlaG (beta-lactamase superfamily)
MKRLASAALCIAGAALLLPCSATAQLQFNSIQPLTNREMLLQLTAPTGLTYRVEATTNIADWSSLLTLMSTGVNRHADSATPWLQSRFYRARELPGTNNITGDHLATTNGDVVIHPMFHATFAMSWNGIVIYNDPQGGEAEYLSTYNGLPKGDLILVSHTHSDHFHAIQIEAVRKANPVIIAPAAVYNHSSMAALRPFTTVLTYGQSTNTFGIRIEAVAATNSNHAPGAGNGYVLTIGGKRIYTSGDTGNIAPIRALQNIDVAFLCMNTPFTMTYAEAVNAVSAFRPKIVYPYHFRNGDTARTTTNALWFKRTLGTNLGIEVRLRKWYNNQVIP